MKKAASLAQNGNNYTSAFLSLETTNILQSSVKLLYANSSFLHREYLKKEYSRIKILLINHF